MKLATWVLVAFVCVLLMSIGCSSSDDVVNTPPGADGACSNPPGVNNRFVDCGNGTVTDTQTVLIWLKKANCFAQQDWDTALASAAGLKSGDCELKDHSSAGDWRLPTLQCVSGPGCNMSDAPGEFSTIFGPACTSNLFILNTAGTGCWTEGNLFSGVQLSNYWSSTTYAGYPGYACGVDLNNGNVNGFDKINPNYVWPVRGGP